jgi:hypothetical protein
MYTHAANVWDLSIVQGPLFSVAPCQTLALRFATSTRTVPLGRTVCKVHQLMAGDGLPPPGLEHLVVHVEDQLCALAIVREALPQLDARQREETHRVAPHACEAVYAARSPPRGATPR